MVKLNHKEIMKITNKLSKMANISKKIKKELLTIWVVCSFYGEVQKQGGNRWDTSSLIKRFRK